MVDSRKGLVIAHLGQGLAIESQGKTLLCQTRRQLGQAAVGDWVRWEPTAPEQGRVLEILPRRSVLNRPARNGKIRPVAANIDKILVVFALQPECDFLLIDQYLAICENRNIDAELVFNKIDQFDKVAPQDTEQQLEIYKNTGYPIHYVSATTGQGLDQLKLTLQNHICMLAGQSGVGKSSLTNALIPDKHLKTNTLSQASGHGRHTP
jgi:ribosome biogenesis GTPase